MNDITTTKFTNRRVFKLGLLQSESHVLDVGIEQSTSEYFDLNLIFYIVDDTMWSMFESKIQ